MNATRITRTIQAAADHMGADPVQIVGRLVRPLIWRPHHAKDNGWHGVTATGYQVCYVYQPWDNRIKRGPMPWQVFSYFGGLDHPLKGSGRFDKFPTAGHAKRAAQKWWKAKMVAMLLPNACRVATADGNQSNQTERNDT